MTASLVANDIPRLIDGGLAGLSANQEAIDRLNVFPVPDGDTGTNMLLTWKQVLAEVGRCDDRTMKALSGAAVYGALMGARGNSGVILSQIVRGIFEVIGAVESAGVEVVARSLTSGAKVAYQAIAKPVEGTMLTVMREMAEAGQRSKDGGSVEAFLETVIEAGRRSVALTPTLLPVLAEAGVVDAGGQGIVVLFEGMLAALTGREVTEAVATVGVGAGEEEVSLTYAYCTEFLLKGDGLGLSQFEEAITPLGDSVMVVGTPALARVHVHTNEPGTVIGLATQTGTISQVSINNMVEQSEERRRRVSQKAASRVGVVAVANGAGIEKIFESLGVARVVSGGQTMNPSAAELLESVTGLGASETIILPNNSNIIMAAQQLAGLPELGDMKVSVVPTKTIPEGFAAALAFDEEAPTRKNVSEMELAASQVKTGEVTRAVRDCDSDAGPVRRGAYIGVSQDKILATGDSLADVCRDLLREIVSGGDEIVTMLLGEELGQEEAEELSGTVRDGFPRLEVEVHVGGQPLYPVIFSVE